MANLCIKLNLFLLPTDAQDEYCPPFVSAYNSMFDYNVICLDWDKLANIFNYISAAMSSNTVGDFVGEKLVAEIFIETVNSNYIKQIGLTLII